MREGLCATQIMPPSWASSLEAFALRELAHQLDRVASGGVKRRVSSSPNLPTISG